jgi:1-aminocyclopropane-1-carboxylate synthase
LITQNNPRLLRILAQWSIQIKISSPADVIFSTLLTDPYLPKFLALNRSRLGKAQAFVRDWFEHRGVFVRPCNAGHFIWVDLASRLEIKTETEEKRIFQRLLDQGVYIVSLDPSNPRFCVSSNLSGVTGTGFGISSLYTWLVPHNLLGG